MVSRLNPPELKRRYEEILRQYGLRTPSPRRGDLSKRVLQEMAQSASAEGSSGQFLSTIYAKTWEEMQESEGPTEVSYNELLLDI